ncbi:MULTISPECIES: hypothetical protein [Lysinibacillus]|uniref:hypothetical protein n=1 Tax=Lysinibacillus TaxID=400634 RepID=UPI00214CF2A5|nr:MULTISPECIES: hypothetical protein [Lysinibacillus]UUV23639.1 hypothetical protein NP781_17675 [Lysinibacillus sp. FN11]UYB46510.1 hypothetical protein OCI51_20280 [Lysinibacillus capsici]
MEEKIFFEKLVSKENIKNVFNEYVAQKTDYLTLEKAVKVPEGLDNIDYLLFQKNISHQVDMIFKRIRRGNYFFYPLREIVISKDPQLNIQEAKMLGKTRVLSIATRVTHPSAANVKGASSFSVRSTCMY